MSHRSSLPIQDQPQHHSQCGEAVPLPHITDILIASGIGRRPVADQAVGVSRRLFDDQRCERESGDVRELRQVEVLPDPSSRRDVLQFQESRWRLIQPAGDRDPARRRRDGRRCMLRGGRNPAAVDQHMAAVVETQRREHIETGDAVVGAIVEPDLAHGHVLPFGDDAPVARLRHDVVARPTRNGGPSAAATACACMAARNSARRACQFPSRIVVTTTTAAARSATGPGRNRRPRTIDETGIGTTRRFVYTGSVR